MPMIHMVRPPYPVFKPGDEAIIKGSFEVVRVNSQTDRRVLVTRAGGQTIYDARKLEPWCSGQCPLQPKA